MEVKKQQFPDWYCPSSSEPMRGSRSGMRNLFLWVLQSCCIMQILSEFCLQNVDGAVLDFSHFCSNSGPAKGLWKPDHVCHWVFDVCWGLGVIWNGWLSNSCNSLTGVTFKGNQLSPDQRISELDRMIEVIEPKLQPGWQTLFTALLSCGLSGLFSLSLSLSFFFFSIVALQCYVCPISSWTAFWDNKLTSHQPIWPISLLGNSFNHTEISPLCVVLV